MKKILALVLALTMVLGVSSVALAEGSAQVFWYTMSDTYLASVRTVLNEKLTEAGIKFVDQDGNATQTTQTDQITTAIATGTDLLAVNIVSFGAPGIAGERGGSGQGRWDPPAVLQPLRVCRRGQELRHVVNQLRAGRHHAGRHDRRLPAGQLRRRRTSTATASSAMSCSGRRTTRRPSRCHHAARERRCWSRSPAGNPPLKFYDESNAQKYTQTRPAPGAVRVAQDYDTTSWPSTTWMRATWLSWSSPTATRWPRAPCRRCNRPWATTTAKVHHHRPVFSVTPP